MSRNHDLILQVMKKDKLMLPEVIATMITNQSGELFEPRQVETSIKSLIKHGLVGQEKGKAKNGYTRKYYFKK